jgi:hypothetical protein
MKCLLPLILCVLLTGYTLHAQTTDTAFAKQWKQVDSLINKGSLPKTASAKVNNIYAEAKKRRLNAQIIKALLYKISLEDKNTEAGINEVVAEWNTEIAEAGGDLQQSLLYVMLAETISQYFSTNYWRIEQRSKTVNYKKDDIATWSKDDFLTVIPGLYETALKYTQLLQQTSLQPYNAIIVKGNVPQLRPTLYDLLANMLLDFYYERYTTQAQPENAFTLNDSMALAQAPVFIKHHFAAADTASFLFKSLLLYQQLVQFHTARNDTAALIDIDVNRITWAHNNATFAGKEAAYKSALTGITKKYPNHPQAAQAWYLLISMMNDDANKYDAFGDTTHHYDFVAIRQWLLQRLAAQPAESEGNSNMQQLLHQIEEKELNTTAESVNVPGLPFRLLVQYKNVDTLYGRIISKKLVDAARDKNDSTFWKQVSTLLICKRQGRRVVLS